MNEHNAAFGNLRAWRRAVEVTVIVAAMTLVGCGEKKTVATAVAAKVNSAEISVDQLNLALQQQRGLKPEATELASRQLLERLIDQELAVQRAVDMKLDRGPHVQLQLEAARRELLSRAYLEKVAEAAPKPTSEEVGRFYEETPALFKERRIYNLQEIAIEAKPEQVSWLRTRLEQAGNFNEFIEQLRAYDLRFSTGQAVRAAEQLPLPSLKAFAAMKDGQAMVNSTSDGAQVIFLASSRLQPVTLEQTHPAIEQFLLNERKREILNKELKGLRNAAKIEYLGKFVGPVGGPEEVAAPEAAGVAPGRGDK